MIRASGVEPRIIEYLADPPTRELLRRKGTPYDELGLDDPSLTEDRIFDAMIAHPILVNRPIVVTGKRRREAKPANLLLMTPDRRRKKF